MESEGKPNWQMLSAKIDQWENESQIATDSGFDSMIAAKLNSTKVRYSEDSWFRFEKELARRRTVRQRVILFQLSSAAALLLFAMLIFQLFPDFINSTDSQDIAVKTRPASDSAADPGGSIEVTEEILTGKANGSGIGHEFSGQNLPIAQTTGDQYTGIFQPVSHQSENIYFGGLTVDRMISMVNPRFNFPNHNKLNFNAFEWSIVITIDERSPGNSPNDQHPGAEASDQAFAVQSENQNPVIAHQESDNSTSNLESVNPAESIELNTKPGFYLAAYTNPSLSFIQSPFDQVFNEPGYSLLRFDAGLGFTAGVNLNKAGINTGVEYGSMDYSPRRIEEYIEDGKSIYLKSIAIKSIRVPLQASYEIFKNRLWEIYCKAGITVNAVLDASYEMEENANGLAYLIENLRTNPSFVNSLYSKKTFEYGILDDGELIPNVSCSADFGVGLKRKVAKDIYVFAEPMLQYEIAGNGFGPNHDKFHNVHLKTGVSVSLN